MPRFDPVQDLSELAVLYGTLVELLALDPAALATVASPVSGWSIEQHLAHVAIANELILRNLKSLAAARGQLLVHGAAVDPRAVAVLSEGRLPRGQAQAPRMVRPPERVDRVLLAQWVADGRAALAELDPRALPADEPKVPHQLLGPLDAPMWARFAVVHTRHHLAIIEEIRAGVASRG